MDGVVTEVSGKLLAAAVLVMSTVSVLVMSTVAVLAVWTVAVLLAAFVELGALLAVVILGADRKRLI